MGNTRASVSSSGKYFPKFFFTHHSKNCNKKKSHGNSTYLFPTVYFSDVISCFFLRELEQLPPPPPLRYTKRSWPLKIFLLNMQAAEAELTALLRTSIANLLRGDPANDFFSSGTGANYNSRNRKRNQPTKDKGQETKDRTRTGVPTSARSGGLNTKAKGLTPDPTPPHAPPPGRWGGRQRKRRQG